MTPELSIKLLVSCPPVNGVQYGTVVHRLGGPWIYVRLDEEGAPWYLAQLTHDQFAAAHPEQLLMVLRNVRP